MLRDAVVGITGGLVAVLVVAVLAANAVGRRLARQLTSFRTQAMRSQEELQRMTDQVMRGERPDQLAAPPPPGRAASGDPFRLLAYDLAQMQHTAGQAILQVAEQTYGRSDQRVEIFVNLARRMQSLVHREIEMLDALEAQVEDPDLLKGLFTVDHLATRMRRQSESLAVLGGSASRRQWSRQVTMHEVLRAAVAEVEQYSRVKIVPPVEGLVRGAAIADIIHLVAELVENATKFSPPRTQALLRAQQVTAGVAIEIEDRGLGMLPADRQRMNALLAKPGRIDLQELLRDGRLGLYVVSTLARRHDIRVQLQGNIYGGTSAVVVLPQALLQDGGERQLPRGSAASRDSGPLRGGADGETARSGTDSSHGHERELVTTGQYAPGRAAGSYPEGTYSARPNAATDPVPMAPAYPPPQPETRAERPRLPSRSVPSAPSASREEQPSGGRPPLPRRRAGASLATHLPDRSGGTGSSPARSADPFQDHTPGLVADFLRGVTRSDEQGSRPEY